METTDDDIGAVEADIGSEEELDFPEDWMVLDDVDEELLEVTSSEPSARDEKSIDANAESNRKMPQPIKRPNQATVEKVSFATPSKQPATPAKSSSLDVQKKPVKSPAPNVAQMTKAPAVSSPKPVPAILDSAAKAKISQPQAQAKSGYLSKTPTTVALDKNSEKATTVKTEGSVTDFKTPPAKQAQQTALKVGEGSQASSSAAISDLQAASKALSQNKSETPTNPSVLSKTALPNNVQGKAPNQTLVRPAANPAVLSDDQKPVQTSQKQTPFQSSAKPVVSPAVQKPIQTPQKSVQISQKQTPVQSAAKPVVPPATQNPVQSSQKPVQTSQKQTPVQSAAKPVVSPATQNFVKTSQKPVQASQKPTPVQSTAKPAVSPATQKPFQTPQKSVQTQQKQTPVQTAAKPVAEKPVQTPQKPAQIPVQPAAKSAVEKTVQTPQKPAQTPQKPAQTPQKPAQTPPKPAQTPPKPAQTPPKPVAKPAAEKPLQTPQKPVQTPQKQTPVQPAAKLTALPSAQKPVQPNQKPCQPTQKPDQPSQKSVVTNQKTSQTPHSEITSPPGIQKSVAQTVTQAKTAAQTATPVQVKLVITPLTMVTPVMTGAGSVKNGKQVSEKSTTSVLPSNTSEMAKIEDKVGTASANYSKSGKQDLTVCEPNTGKPDDEGLPYTLQQKDKVSANANEKTNASNLETAKYDQNKTVDASDKKLDDKRDESSSKNAVKSGLVGKEKAASTSELDKADKIDDRKDKLKMDKEKENQSSVDRSNWSSRSYDRRRSRSHSRGRSRESSRYSRREDKNSSRSRDRKRDDPKKSSSKDISVSRKKELSVSQKGVQTEENDALLPSIQQFDQLQSEADPCNDMDMKQADKLFEMKSSELGLWRFALKVYPLEINDLSRQELLSIINTAQDYAFIFRNQGLQKKKKGEARMFFNRLLTTKCFMQKLFLVQLSTKKFQIEISRKLLDTEDKDTVVIDIDMTNPGLLTSATATSMAVSKGPAEEKIVHISNVPKGITQELFFVVFPTAYSIQMPTEGKDKGTVVLQFRSGQCAEDVITCYTGVLINKARLKIARMVSGFTRKEDVPEGIHNKCADAKKLEPSKKKSKTSLKIDAEKTANSTKQNNKSLDLVPVKVFTIPVLNQRVHTTVTSTSATAAVAGNRRKLSTSDDHQPEIKIPRMDQPPPFQRQNAPQSFSGFNPPMNVPPPIGKAVATATDARTITQETSAIMPGTFPGFSVRPPGQPVMSSQTSSVWTGSGQSVAMHQMDRSKMITGMQQIGVPSYDWQMQPKMHNRCDVRGAENISPEWKEERPKFSLSKDISESRDLDMKEREAERGRGAINRQSFSPLGQHRNSLSPARFGQVFRGRQSRSPRRRPRSISPVGSVIAHRRSRSPMRQQHAKSRSPSRAGGQKSFSPRSHRRLSISPKNTKSLGRMNVSNSSRLSRSPGKRHSSPQRDLTRRSSQNLGYQESKNFTRNESRGSSSPLRQNLNSGRDKIIDKEPCKMTRKERKEQSFRAQPSSGPQQKSFGTGREEMSLKHQNVATGWFEDNPVKASGRQEHRNLSPRNPRSISQEHSRYNSTSQGISIQSHHNEDRETSPDLKIRVGPSGNRETYTRRSPSPRRVVELYTSQQPLTSGRSAGESRSTFSPQRYPDKERLGAEQFRGKEQSWSGHSDGTHKAAAGPGSKALSYPSKTEETASTGSRYPSNTATTAASLDIPGLDLLIKAMTKDSGSAERGLMKLWPGSVDTGKGQADEKGKQERGSGWWREDSKSSPVFDKPGNRESFSRENQGLKTTRDLMTLRQEAAKHLANVEKTNLGSTQVLQTSRPDVGLTMSNQQSMRSMSMASEDVSTRDTFLANVQIDSRSSLDNSSANPTGHFSWGNSNSSSLQQPSLERTSLDRRLADIQGFDRPSMQEPSWMGPNRVGIERKGFDQAIWPEGGGNSLNPGSSNWMTKNIVQDYGHGRSNQPRDDLGMSGANPGRPGLVQAMGLGGGDARDLPRPGWGRGEARPGSLDREQAGSWPGMPGSMATRGGLGDMGRGMGTRENMGGTVGLGGRGGGTVGLGGRGGRGGFGMTGDLGGRGEMGLGGVSRDMGRPGNSGEPFGGSWLPPPSQPGPNQFMPYR